MAQTPNIVFIMADQLAARSIGCYGSGVNSTPILDDLATRGVRFERCYAHVPVCAPNRASIFTGRASDIHGVVVNNLMLPCDSPTMAHVLQRQGYRTGGFGKFHLTPMQMPLPEDFSYLGFDESVPTEDPRLGPWLDWIEAEHPDHYAQALATCWPMPYIDHYGPSGRNLRPAWELARREHLEPRASASPWRRMYTSPLPPELQQTAYITDLGLDFIQRHLEEHSSQPFFTFLSYVNPHDPYDPPAPYDTLFAPEKMPAPLPMRWPQYGCQALERARDFAGFREAQRSEHTMLQLRALYHGLIRMIDDQIARIVRFLAERDLWANTILVFTTDHGDMIGDHGLITKGPMHYDGSIRVPLIVHGAGISQGVVTDRLTSSLDVFPSLLDWAGVETAPPHEGRSVAPLTRGEEAEMGWQTVTVQAPPRLGADATGGVRSIITDDSWRLTVFDEEGQGELHNLYEDPDEQRNLFYEPAHQETKLALYQRLVRAYMRPFTTPQFRNLLEIDGHRYVSSILSEPIRRVY